MHQRSIESTAGPPPRAHTTQAAPLGASLTSTSIYTCRCIVDMSQHSWLSTGLWCYVGQRAAHSLTSSSCASGGPVLRRDAAIAGLVVVAAATAATAAVAQPGVCSGDVRETQRMRDRRVLRHRRHAELDGKRIRNCTCMCGVCSSIVHCAVGAVGLQFAMHSN